VTDIKGIGHRPGFAGEDAGLPVSVARSGPVVRKSSSSKVAIAGGYWIRNGADERMDQDFDALYNGSGVVASSPAA
jgi:hypothetical protein